MSAPDKNGWMPWSTCPRDGSVFLACDDYGLPLPVFIETVEPRVEAKRRWWGESKKVVAEKGGQFLAIAMPMGGGRFCRMNVRPDFGWIPNWWKPLPARPVGEPAE